MLPLKLKSMLRPSLRIVLSCTLIGGLAYFIGSKDILEQIKTVPWGVLVSVVALLASNVLIVTPRWKAILYALEYRIQSTALMGSVFVGFLFNQLLPSGVGGDVLRAWRAKELGVPLEAAIHSVLIDRASGVFISFLGVLVLFPFAKPENGREALGWLTALTAVMGVTGCSALWAFGYVPPLGARLMGALQRRILNLRYSLRLLIAHRSAAPTVFALACLNQLLPVGAIWILARELHVDIAISAIAFVTFASTLVSTLPISIAGWGVRESALVLLLGFYGVQPGTAFALSVLYGACLTLSGIPGILLLIAQRLKPPRTDAAI